MAPDPWTVVITGASSGIGRATALAYGRGGHRVVLAARDPVALRRVAAEVEEAGGTAVAIATDVTRDDDVAAFAGATLEAFGPADIVIANAGYGHFGALADTRIDDVRALMDTNFLGVVRVAQAFHDQLSDRRGRFVIVGSVFARAGLARFAPYAASKFAVRGLAQALRAEWAPEGISVTLVNPGSTRTAFHGRSAVGGDAPMARLGQLRERGIDPVRVARALVRGARRRRREVTVPWTSRLFLAAHAIAPRAVAYVARRSLDR